MHVYAVFLRAEGAQELVPSSLHCPDQTELAASAFIGVHLRLPSALLSSSCSL
jgi:hypothetical protein